MGENILSLRVVLDGIRERINYGFLDYQKTISDAVEAQLKEKLTTRNLEAEIGQAIDEALDNAIKAIASDHTIRSILSGIVRDTLDENWTKLQREKDSQSGR